jgi:hypothetical protein
MLTTMMMLMVNSGVEDRLLRTLGGVHAGAQHGAPLDRRNRHLVQLRSLPRRRHARANRRRLRRRDQNPVLQTLCSRYGQVLKFRFGLDSDGRTDGEWVMVLWMVCRGELRLGRGRDDGVARAAMVRQQPGAAGRVHHSGGRAGGVHV